VLDWPQDVPQHYAEICFDLEKRGTQLGTADLMLAAHARAVGAAVVTSNIKDFGRVKGWQFENCIQ
jgi:tRNA(fMet)-specific endonuclease VapC